MRVIEDAIKGSSVAAVIPTMDVNQTRARRLASELDSLGVDALFVEDSGPSFRFARSMNAGIKALLTRPHIRYIVLSNDDVYEIRDFDDMLNALREGKCSYTQPYVNGVRSSFVLMDSLPRLMLNYGIRNRAPFYALRLSKAARIYGGSKKPIISAPTVLRRNEIISVQPFGLFDRRVLQRELFDENFCNGVEDIELAYRLHLLGFKGLTDARWRISHVYGESFKSNNTRASAGSYYGDDRQMGENWGYFNRKHGQ